MPCMSQIAGVLQPSILETQGVASLLVCGHTFVDFFSVITISAMTRDGRGVLRGAIYWRQAICRSAVVLSSTIHLLHLLFPRNCYPVSRQGSGHRPWDFAGRPKYSIIEWWRRVGIVLKSYDSEVAHWIFWFIVHVTICMLTADIRAIQKL